MKSEIITQLILNGTNYEEQNAILTSVLALVKVQREKELKQLQEKIDSVNKALEDMPKN